MRVPAADGRVVDQIGFVQNRWGAISYRENGVYIWEEWVSGEEKHTYLGAILEVFLERPAVEGRECLGADGGSKGDGDEERHRQSRQEALVEYGR